MATQKDIFSTNEGKWDFVIALIVIALVGIFIYMMIFSKNKAEIPNIENKIETQADVIKDEEIETVVGPEETRDTWRNEAPLRVSEVRRTNAIDGNDRELAKIITDYEVSEEIPEKDALATTSEEDKPMEVEKEIIERKIKEVEESEIQNVAPETAVLEEETEIEATEENLEEITPTPVDVEPVNATIVKECSVIVGSFKNPNNIRKVIEKLAEMELEIVQGQTRPGLNYVGVPVECGDTNAHQELVKVLNRTFDIEAWVKRK